MSNKVTAVLTEAAAKRTYWARRNAEWERSGQSQRAFCAEHGLVLSTFLWWRTRTKRRDAAKPVTPFLPIALHATSVVEVEHR